MSYWKNRQLKALQALENDEAKIIKRLNRFYDAEVTRLDRAIAAYYKQYAKNDVIEFRRLTETLPVDDAEMLWQDWNAFAERYPQYAYLMPVRETIYKLNRLEGLQMSAQIQLYEMNAQANGIISQHLSAVSMKAFKDAAQAMGHEYNDALARQFVDTQHTSADDFSERIWNQSMEQNTSKLSAYVNQELSQGFARGDSYQRLTKNVTERFTKVSKRDAYRLVYTEGTFAYNQATMSVVSEDFEQYKYSPIKDSKTCEICEALRGKIFNMKDAEAGVNFPPMHPWCRCSFEVVLPETEDARSAWIADYVLKHGGDADKANTILRRFTS